ncbi:MAG: tail fiber domain-containing protein [Terriglobales bacterium]
MKKVHVVMFSALLLLFFCAWSQAQQSLASTGLSSDSQGDSQVVKNATGKGTTDYVPLWLSTTKLGNSNIFQSSSGIGIGTTSPAATLDVNGAVNAAGYNVGGLRFAYGSAASGNAFLGFAGNSTTTGGNNTAIGLLALGENTTGNYSTAVGEGALAHNTTGGNTAIGFDAMFFNTNGDSNTAIGLGALEVNSTGSFNAATGAGALANNATGAGNTASGFDALYFNTTGSSNTAIGGAALEVNSTGGNNTASGYEALAFNTTGSNNTASGYEALAFNKTGSNNTASGFGALYYNATGGNNTALGYGASPDVKSPNLSYATAIGAGAVVSQSNALILGGPLGSAAQVKVGIGTATPANVFTIAQGAGAAVSDGWNVYSSRRWKTNIETLRGALGKVEQLRGVSYELKANGKHEVGVIAEEVGAVVPEVVTWDQNGQDAQSVDYSRLTALLIEATKEQQALIAQQQEQMKTQQEQINQLISEVKTIQASFKTSGRAGSKVRTIDADLRTVHP